MNLRLLTGILVVASTCGLACSSGSSGGGGGSGSGGSSGGGGGGEQKVLCNRPDTNQCGIFTVVSTDVSAWKQQCAQEGGTVVDACPTANLDGCCTYGPLEYCYYNGSATQQKCQDNNGTWSTSI